MSKPKAANAEVLIVPDTSPTPTRYTFATQAIIMAYTLLAPDETSVVELTQHLTDLKRQATDGLAPRLPTERALFFEALDALNDGLSGKWFRHGD